MCVPKPGFIYPRTFTTQAEVAPTSSHHAPRCQHRAPSIPLLSLQVGTASLKKNNCSDAFSISVITYPSRYAQPHSEQEIPRRSQGGAQGQSTAQTFTLIIGLAVLPIHHALLIPMHIKPKQTTDVCSNLSVLLPLN